MKKMLILAICLFMTMFVSQAAFAATAATTTGGAKITLTGASANIEYTPSPSTIMNIVTSADAYTVVSASSKTDTKTGLEFCLISGDNTVYQKTQGADGAVTSAGDTAGGKPEGFAAKGASTSSSQ